MAWNFARVRGAVTQVCRAAANATMVLSEAVAHAASGKAHSGTYSPSLVPPLVPAALPELRTNTVAIILGVRARTRGRLGLAQVGAAAARFTGSVRSHVCPAAAAGAELPVAAAPPRLTGIQDFCIPRTAPWQTCRMSEDALGCSLKSSLQHYKLKSFRDLFSYSVQVSLSRTHQCITSVPFLYVRPDVAQIGTVVHIILARWV